MKLLHTADLHLGQIIYQNYDRCDEHDHFFGQLEQWCTKECPDALLVSGDVFDLQQPSSTVKKAFNDYFVKLHTLCPNMHIVVIAGNHDSASRIQAEHSVWQLANTHLIGVPPAIRTDMPDAEVEKYIIRLKSGYIIALPYMSGERREWIQAALDKVAQENTSQLPVVMMGHMAVSGSDITGHDFDIGHLKTQDLSAMGSGYDYLALGHIHKPQTINHPDDNNKDETNYPAPIARYSGSALHVSCDETYPHTVSLVEIDRHQGNVRVRQLRIDELRHFYVLPLDGTSYATADHALEEMDKFVAQGRCGYIRFRMENEVQIPSDFNQRVYDHLSSYNDEWRYNPKILWTGTEQKSNEQEKMVFEVAELQQMSDPLQFIERTADQYPGLDMDEVRAAFEDIKKEVKRMEEEK